MLGFPRARSAMHQGLVCATIIVLVLFQAARPALKYMLGRRVQRIPALGPKTQKY